MTKHEPEKSLLEPQRKTGGRNSFGRETARRRGGGHKRMYRRIDFKRDKLDVPAKVAGIEYDPNRSANIALLNYQDGEKRYILCPKGLKVGDLVVSAGQADIRPGNAMPLEAMPLGTHLHNVVLKSAARPRCVRRCLRHSDGQEGGYAPSSCQRRGPGGSMNAGPIGEVGNEQHENVSVARQGAMMAGTRQVRGWP